MSLVKELATFLLKSNALRFGVFKLSSGRESPYYIDLRVLPSFPKYFKLVVAAYRETVEKEVGMEKIDYLCSVPTSGLVFASALAYGTGKPLVYARKEAKEHGTGKVLEGYLKPGAKVLVVDDVATTGLSITEAVQAVRSNGGLVEHALVLLDRMEGASGMLRKQGVKLVAVSRMSDIAEVLFENGLLEKDVLTTVRRQIRET